MELTKNSKISDLREELEIRMAMDCYSAEVDSQTKGIPFECKCVDPWKLTQEQLLHYLGIKDD